MSQEEDHSKDKAARKQAKRQAKCCARIFRDPAMADYRALFVRDCERRKRDPEAFVSWLRQRARKGQ